MSISLSMVLVFTLAVVVFAVYELTLTSERNDLDEILIREGMTVSNLLIGSSESFVAEEPNSMLTSEKIRDFSSRALALHPGSALHMVVVRWEGQTLTSARGPSRLIELRDLGILPVAQRNSLKSVAGIRSRSQTISFTNLDVIVETLGDDSAIAADAQDVASRTFIATAIGGILGLFAISFTVKQSTRAISEVSLTVKKTQLDDLSRRIHSIQGSHEVSELARDVNKMLDNLSEARATRNELIASVSHEIRTPLAAARGHMDLLRLNRTIDPELTIARIDRELVRMTRLVDDLLALSRATDPAWLSLGLVKTQTILNSVSERIVTFESPHITVESAPDILIEVDADRILQALTNLVRNSVLHNPAGTKVSVAAQVLQENVEFVVADNGTGIPPQILDQVGEAFVRGSETGTGLGLAVTRAVATAHSGSLSVQSNEHGTKVVMVIPIEQPIN